MEACKARQFSDQMCCSKCNLAWDMNDPEPPLCVNQTSKPITVVTGASRKAREEPVKGTGRVMFENFLTKMEWRE